MAGLVVAVALRGVAIDQGPAIERMGLAAHFVLDGEQHLARFEIDDVLEAILVVVDLEREEAERLEPAIRSGEIRDIDLRVMPVIELLGSVGLAEVPVLLLAHLNAGAAAAAIIEDGRKRPHDVAIETSDAVRRARTHVECD